MSQRSTASVFWGLILVGIGAILLLKNLGYEIPIWAGVARYWPVLLIVWGLIKLIDYARWKRAGQPGPLFGAGEVVLLIIIILSGTALTAASNINPDLASLFDWTGIDWPGITGNSYQFSEQYTKDVPGGSSIEIINRYGDVVITPADTDRISVDVAKTVIASNETEANELAKVLMYSIVEEGGRYRVVSNYNRDENRVRGRRFKTSLTIQVPKRSSLSVNNRNGAIDLSGITGDQQVLNAFGRVLVSRISGGVDIKSRNDNVVVEDISGMAKISNEFGNVEARRVSGTLNVELRNGNVDVDEVKADTRISNAFGSISAKNIQGSLTSDSRMTSVDLAHVENNATISAQFGSVKLEDVKGTVSVENKNGDVEVRYVQPPRNNLRVTSKFGHVFVTLPANSSFSIDARTRYASISSDFSELEPRNEDQRNNLTGRVGTGGPEIRIDNQNGNISIYK